MITRKMIRKGLHDGTIVLDKNRAKIIYNDFGQSISFIMGDVLPTYVEDDAVDAIHRILRDKSSAMNIGFSEQEYDHCVNALSR